MRKIERDCGILPARRCPVRSAARKCAPWIAATQRHRIRLRPSLSDALWRRGPWSRLACARAWRGLLPR